ncbi:ABC transporter permease [Ancylobacter vacuolatus]|uniref:Iron(III) transport system permease protein n=1 Tax=Ancylobacter vacuolatus TaxID=223389 RepID=A0ABU0DNU7_9HYPH|nr:iron ABC transporter permease [Ancylobacter vacuolatus]MDQ0350101.1 iron(III) transport system permease protein [Ancylobacter vacuolatus]
MSSATLFTDDPRNVPDSPALLQRLSGIQPVKLLVIGFAIVVLLALIAYPLALLIGYSLIDAQGNLTFDTFEKAFNRRGMWAATVNSTVLVGLVTAGACALGIPLAWIVARTDAPGKILVTLAAGISFVIPSFISVVSWIFLAAPNSGYLNKLAVEYLGFTQAPFNIMSFGGLVFIEIIGVYPLVFFAVSAALHNVDASNEQAARVLGAGRLRTTLTITLPLVRPAILSAIILVMLDALSSFGAPAAIGTMANFSVITTKIYDLLKFPPQFNYAAAVAMPIMVFTAVSLLIQKYAVRAENFRTLTGKATSAQITILGRWRWLAAGFGIVVVFATAVLPVGALLLLSVLSSFGTDVSLSNLVTKHYALIFDADFVARGSIINSLLLALATATVCAGLGLVLGWVVERVKFFGREAITFLVMIAYGFPSIAYAVGILMGYVNLFYGTLTLILIAYAGKLLPIAFVLVRNGIQQLSTDLEEAARISGAGWLRSVRDVTFPLVRGAVGIAWVLVFSLSLRELSMSAILSQADTQVMPTVVIQFIEDGAIELAAALSVVIVTVSLSILGLIRFFSRKKTAVVS